MEPKRTSAGCGDGYKVLTLLSSIASSKGFEGGILTHHGLKLCSSVGGGVVTMTEYGCADPYSFPLLGGRTEMIAAPAVVGSISRSLDSRLG